MPTETDNFIPTKQTQAVEPQAAARAEWLSLGHELLKRAKARRQQAADEDPSA